MNARYELVGVDSQNKGKVIESKKGTKLTLQELDLFTTLFSSPQELTMYLKQKGYLDDFHPVNYVAIYKVNNTHRYVNCCYKSETDIITLAKSSKNTNKVNERCGILRNLLNTLFCSITSANMQGFLEFALTNRYINEYIYKKMIEYKKAVLHYATYNETTQLQRQITNELTKEYLQVRKLYDGLNAYKARKRRIDIDFGEIKKVVITGNTDEPYINYLVQRANKGDENAYEELMGMELEKTRGLKLR